MEAKNIVRMNKYFKENGYITNYCSHLCQKDNALTGHNTTESELYDHQMLLCDPNAPRYSKPIRKCMYGKDDVGFLLICVIKWDSRCLIIQNNSGENIKIIENFLL